MRDLELSPLSAEQRVTVRGLLERHAAETGSTVAAALLARWPQAADEFTALVPRAWRRAREVMRAAQERGVDVDAAVMAEMSAPAGEVVRG